jgi:hypothetical protein
MRVEYRKDGGVDGGVDGAFAKSWQWLSEAEIFQK